MEIQTLAKLDTELSADSVEWCPMAPHQHLFVCGTYQLTEGVDNSTSSRVGQLQLLSLVDNDQVLKRLQTLNMPAVLDCKWALKEVFNKTLLAVANAVGEVSVFFLSSEAGPTLVQETKAILPKQDKEQELLALSLDWSVTGDAVKIGVSDSQGCISVLRLDHSGLHVEYNWKAHEFEAWTVHWDSFNSNICFTGGDDCKLRMYDMRNCGQVCTTSNAHTAGVTSFSSSRKEEYSLLSGSYDEQVLQWDTRQMKRAVATATTGGGVWRLRRQPISEKLVLAACMYNGFLVLDNHLQPVVSYSEHSSIAYGADWAHLDSSAQFPNLLAKGGSLIATCSFYDHKLCVSLLNNKINN